MKKILIVMLLASPLLACGGGAGRKANPEADSLKMELRAKDSLLSEVFTSLNVITSNLNQIKSREDVITSNVDNGELKREPTAAIREDIAAIDRMLQDNKQTIEKLQQDAQRLRKANIRISSLEKLIAEMTAQVEAKDMEIASLKKELQAKNVQIGELSGKVSDLSTQVTGLTEDTQRLASEVTRQGNVIHTGYYIVGSRKELTDKRVVVKSGFIGRTLKVNENYDLGNFTQVDTRNFDEIVIGRKGVQLVTSHPEDSYQLVMNENQVFQSLIIIDKSRFWEYSKVLIVSYK